MNIIKEDAIIDDTIVRKLTNMCTFASCKANISKGSIRYVPRTNIAYIEPNRLEVNNKMYLIFGNKEINYIGNNTLYNKMSLNELENNIRRDVRKFIN